jgi:hypothetical protein
MLNIQVDDTDIAAVKRYGFFYLLTVGVEVVFIFT